ncbi:hypothetical protein CARUB_v10006804mg [Capsella rubella]|uniref:Defensin-like protein n=1 Tax=Capsella rubella TaxID=81985 RepID=R0F8M2_9BRAS|nr:defensin-like protein 171 [Capsella rubella]EOA18297.1 hypothetical protein CARUB_v10006804mg [Capsella rubella]
MTKRTSSFFLPIIFLVMFVLVEQNMGETCTAVLGSCGVIPDCSAACKAAFGPTARGFCDRDGGAGTCVCLHPCLTDNPHM